MQLAAHLECGRPTDFQLVPVAGLLLSDSCDLAFPEGKNKFRKNITATVEFYRLQAILML